MGKKTKQTKRAKINTTPTNEEQSTPIDESTINPEDLSTTEQELIDRAIDDLVNIIKNEGILTEKNDLTAGEVVELTTKVMKLVEGLPHLTPEGKKMVVNAVVRKLIEETVTDSKMRDYILAIQQSVTPAIIELAVEVSNGSIRFNSKITTTNNCLGCLGCFGCGCDK